MSFAEFTKQTKVSKTIRAEIIPRPETAKNLATLNLLEEDKKLYEKRTVVNGILNDMMDNLIHEKLGNAHIDFQPLFQAMDKYYDQKKNLDKNDDALKELAKAEKELNEAKNQCRKEIIDSVASKSERKELTACSVISKRLPGFVSSYSGYTEAEKEEKREVLNLYTGMNTYFQSTCKTLESLFSTDKNANGLASRIVDTNADLFRANYYRLQVILQEAPDQVKEVDEKNKDMLDGWTILQLLDYEAYYICMTQKGIDFYNMAVGFLNEQMNLFCQEHGRSKQISRYKLATLQKQIRSKSVSCFELPARFESDEEVYHAAAEFFSIIEENHVLERLSGIPENLALYDLGKIYLSKYAHGNISNYIAGEWDYLYSSCWNYFDSHISPKVKSKREDKIRSAYKNTPLSIQKLNEIRLQFGISEKGAEPVEAYFSKIRELAGLCSTACPQFDSSVSLIEAQIKITELKNSLDPYLDVLRWLKDFKTPDMEEIDSLFYNELNDLLASVEHVTPLYNKVRNYVTRKPYRTEKYSVHMGAVSLGSGWSINKMKDNCQSLIKCGDEINFVVWNTDKATKKEVATVLEQASEIPVDNSNCRLMVFNQIPKPYMSIPHVLLSESCRKAKKFKEYPISDHILDVYLNDRYKKTPDDNGISNFDLQCMWDLIDYFKNILLTCEDYTEYYHFQFLPTKEYQNINEFYDDVDRQSNTIFWKYLSENEVSRLEKEGKIFMFTLHTKDFSKKSHGKQNLHTMYLKQIFSDQKVKEPIVALNGGVELFYRESSIKNPVIHKKGDILVNKTYAVKTENGIRKLPIPDGIYCELKKYLTGKKKTLSSEAWPYLDKVTTRTAPHDIVKDKRYTTGKYFIHIPITINPFASKNYKANEKVHRYVVKNDVNVLGIIRGERNLLYVSVINRNGEILEQKSLNVLNGYDYKAKLLQRERERTKAQKEWEEEDKIKDLKKGYLSFAIREICDLVLKYNAVIAMEDLNYSFKEKRTKIERNVYQQFETALINKLNYLVSKDAEPEKAGGLLNGYQLTYIPESLKKVGRQCGIIFYVPKNYTASIDPSTGFANLFNLNQLKNTALREEFFRTFRSIHYDQDKKLFCFSFNYMDFVKENTKFADPQRFGIRTEWDVYSYGTRLREIRKNNIPTGISEEIHLTEKLSELFSEYGFYFQDGHNLLDDMISINHNKAAFYSRLEAVFKLILQMRNFHTEDEPFYDHMVSPVTGSDGQFFDTDMYDAASETVIPKEGGAVAAYCIAMKGLMNVEKIRNIMDSGKSVKTADLEVTNPAYFNFLSANSNF